MKTVDKTNQEIQRTIDHFKSTNDKWLCEEFVPEIVALVKKFGESGQSGASAPYTANAIADTVKKLCLHQPIIGITGSDDEWVEVDYGLSYDGKKTITKQNRHCSAVFMDSDFADGRPYYLDAIIWKEKCVREDESGKEYIYDSCFSGTVEGISSRQVIAKFPFTPTTYYVEVKLDAETDEYFIVESLPTSDIYDFQWNRK